MTNQEFIQSVIHGAKEAFKKYKVLPSLTMSQACLESGYGKYAPGNNIFGIKWISGCGYDKQLLPTTEYIRGKAQKIQAYFRKYNSLADSINDHGRFLAANSRYEKVLRCNNYKDACTAVQEAGYATNPKYAELLINIIEQFEFCKYDTEAAVENLTGTVIHTPDAWVNVVPSIAVSGRNVEQLIKNFVAMYKLCSTMDEVYTTAVQLGIISSPEYWKLNAVRDGTVDGEYAQRLLINMANRL